MKYNYQLFADNAGGLHLAVLDSNDRCVYYLTDLDQELVRATLADLKAGGDPIEDCWEGGEDDPEECYRAIQRFVEARNGSAEEVEE